MSPSLSSRLRTSAVARVLLLALAWFLLTPLAASARRGGSLPPARALEVLTWTDLHLGSEAFVPEAWREACDEGVRLHPDVVVMTGDLADNYQCSRAQFLAHLEANLPRLREQLDRMKAPVMMAYGNNDFADNYQTDPATLSTTDVVYHRLLGSYDYLDELGNGLYPIRVGGMAWVSLNTQIFSPNNRYAGRAAQADRTFRWLEATLRRLPPTQPMVVLTHIPPTFDLWSGRLSWYEADVARFAALLGRHNGRIVILGGHYHRNELHGFMLPGRGPVPLLVAGSLSFKFGNFPNWRSGVWSLGSDGSVARFDWRSHYPGHADWARSWSLASPYTTSSYGELMTRLRGEVAFYLAYIEDLYAHHVDWKKWADASGKRALLVDTLAPTPAEGPLPAHAAPSAPASLSSPAPAASPVPLGRPSPVPVP